MDVIFADMGVDQKGRRAAGRRQVGDGRQRAEHEVADAAHVEHSVARTDGIDDAFELGDHAGEPFAPAPAMTTARPRQPPAA